ncbi:hypothetical protein DPMN_071442 [Dreissena polymorpha]|uniref:Uncharacterized protein n=1 Tax=Dreissena polymorpha TaxID=45954 RepID=A0A9D4BXC7_DREPO|nr:hypothetical protein DPMN_071442 [Dreissena polymorpha]
MADKQRAAKQLSCDIKNSIYHIFGEHDNCSLDFCKAKHCLIEEKNSEDQQLNIENHNSGCDDFILQQSKYWSEGMSMNEQEIARESFYSKSGTISEIKKVIPLLNRVADTSNRLIGNFTSNLCES